MTNTPAVTEMPLTETSNRRALRLAERSMRRREATVRVMEAPQKDLIEMVLISELAEFEADRLKRTIDELFRARATHAVPVALARANG